MESDWGLFTVPVSCNKDIKSNIYPGWSPCPYLKGSPPLSQFTMPSPPPVFGDEARGLTGFRSLTPGPPPASLPRPVVDNWPGTLLNALLDFASNNLTVSLTRDLGLGGTMGFTGDLSGGLPEAEADFVLSWPLVPGWEDGLKGEREARMESLSSSLLGRLMGRGIRDLPEPLLDLPLSPEAEPGLPASLVGVVWPVPRRPEEHWKYRITLNLKF